MMWGMATFILLAGMVDDFRSRKIHNILLAALLAAAFAYSIFAREWHATLFGLCSLALALAITFPLFAARVFGGGDIKLLAVFAFAVEPAAMLWTLAYSVFWGGLFGLARSALEGQLPLLVRNTYRTLNRQKVEAQQLQKIPYSFALLLGWLTYITMVSAGGPL
jgi:Flp pilus assembly protein protease CpaA